MRCPCQCGGARCCCRLPLEPDQLLLCLPQDIGGMPLGVKALNTYPLKSAKRDKGLRDVPISFAGVTVKPGDWVYADKVRGGECR